MSANGLHLCKWTVALIEVTLSHLNRCSNELTKSSKVCQISDFWNSTCTSAKERHSAKWSPTLFKKKKKNNWSPFLISDIVVAEHEYWTSNISVESLAGVIYSEVNVNITNIRSVFRSNKADSGGVIATYPSCGITNINCSFERNVASFEGGVIFGSGLHTLRSHNSVYNRWEKYAVHELVHIRMGPSKCFTLWKFIPQSNHFNEEKRELKWLLLGSCSLVHIKPW